MRSALRTSIAGAAAALLLLVSPSGAQAGDLSPASLDPGPPEYPKVVRVADVPITMRDGVKLYADVYRPADASGKAVPGRFPIVLNEIIFNKNMAVADRGPAGFIEQNSSGYTPLFVQHGYVQVVVDLRGTGSSEGKWDMWGRDIRQDAADIARWVVSRPFSDGKFVGYGASCMAISQLFMAAQHPPGLKALFPIVAMDDFYRDVMWHGGAVDAPFFTVWHGAVAGAGLLPPTSVVGDPLGTVLTGASRPGNQAAAETLAHSHDGDFWQERSPGRVVGEIDVPTFVVGGWYDLLQRGTPRVYNDLTLRPGRKQLLMGPWYHLTVGEGLGAPGTPPPIDVLALAWFDRWVKGERNGIERYGPVTVQQLGTKRWETYPRYPRRDATHRRFYLAGDKDPRTKALADGSLLNDGSLSSHPPEEPRVDALPGNTAAGLCSRSTTQWSASFVPPGQPCETDNRVQEATALTYTTGPLRKPLHLSGPLSLTLNASTTARDATWIATVTDVAPGGKSSQITAGWLIHSRRALDRSRTEFTRAGDPIVPFHPFTEESVLPVRPNAKDTLAIEILNTDAVVRTGHRLRVTISSGDVSHSLAPPESALRGVPAVGKVHHGGRSQSFLTATVVPARRK